MHEQGKTRSLRLRNRQIFSRSNKHPNRSRVARDEYVSEKQRIVKLRSRRVENECILARRQRSADACMIKCAGLGKCELGEKYLRMYL